MQTLWTLAVSFVIIGIGAYGGGLVTVPLMNRELVVTRQFLSLEEMSRIVAIAQMTPGPIAVNAATFVGYRVAGLAGALVASFSSVLPAIAILGILGLVGDRLPPSPIYLRIQRGLRIGVLSLLLFAIWSYGQGVVTGLPELAIAVGSFLVLVLFEKKVHPLAVILGSGVIGLLIFR